MGRVTSQERVMPRSAHQLAKARSIWLRETTVRSEKFLERIHSR
jgi:hypothetical protein